MPSDTLCECFITYNKSCTRTLCANFPVITVLFYMVVYQVFNDFLSRKQPLNLPFSFIRSCVFPLGVAVPKISLAFMSEVFLINSALPKGQKRNNFRAKSVH